MNKKGYTLIEMIVVLIIMGVLVTLVGRFAPRLFVIAEESKNSNNFEILASNLLEYSKRNGFPVVDTVDGNPVMDPDSFKYLKSDNTTSFTRDGYMGYLIPDTLIDDQLCYADPTKLMTLKICKDAACTAANAVKYEDVALFMYSLSKESLSGMTVNYSNMDKIEITIYDTKPSFGASAQIMATPDYIAYRISELKKIFNCITPQKFGVFKLPIVKKNVAYEIDMFFNGAGLYCFQKTSDSTFATVSVYVDDPAVLVSAIHDNCSAATAQPWKTANKKLVFKGNGSLSSATANYVRYIGFHSDGANIRRYDMIIPIEQ